MGLIDAWRERARETRETMMVGAAVSSQPGPAREPATCLSEPEYVEYERVAALVGFAPRGLKSDALRRFLNEIGIAIYPLDKVKAYLTEQYGEPHSDRGGLGLTATWVWAPLRAADQFDKTTMDRYRESISGGWAARLQENGAVARHQAPYKKPVPLPVLLTVERILSKFPDALFFVNDEYHAPPIVDPFLAVLYGEDTDPLVIERWDEPSFRR